jgi:hypothetical protein
MRPVVALLLSALACATYSPTAAVADVIPSAPQAGDDGIDGADFVRVPPGEAGFVDPAGLGYCRYVSNSGAYEDVIPVGGGDEWLSYRANPPAGISEVVCCRPQNASPSDFCAYGGTPVIPSPTLSYSIVSGSVSVPALCAHTCTDNRGASYDCSYADAVTYSCGQTGSGAMADGAWIAAGQTETCSGSYHTSGCSVTCGGGTQEIYDGCGRAVASQSCNTQSCPPPNPFGGECTATATSCAGGQACESVYAMPGTDAACGFSQACGSTDDMTAADKLGGTQLCTQSINIPIQDYTTGWPGNPSLNQWFGVCFDAGYTAPVAGYYVIALANVDDGAALWINGNDFSLASAAINAQGSAALNHPNGNAAATVYLNAGLQDLVIKYWQGWPSLLGIQLVVTPPGGQPQIMPLTSPPGGVRHCP